MSLCNQSTAYYTALTVLICISNRQEKNEMSIETPKDDYRFPNLPLNLQHFNLSPPDLNLLTSDNYTQPLTNLLNLPFSSAKVIYC